MEADVQQVTRDLQKLQRITEVALTHLAMDDLLAPLLEQVTEVLEGDAASVLLLTDDGRALEPRGMHGLDEGLERGVLVPVGEGFAGRIVAERRTLVVDDLDAAGTVTPAVRERGLRSLLGAPLIAHGGVIGVLQVGSLRASRFGEEDAELLQRVADRAALAIDHARLYGLQVAARREAEATAERLTRLERITEAALAHMALDDLLAELLQRATEILDVDTAAVLLLSSDGRELVARAAKGIEEEVERGVRIPVGKGFAGRIAAKRAPVAVDDIDHADILNPILREKGLRSLLGVPLLVGGAVIGVLHVGSLSGRLFTDEDTRLLQLAGDRAALAISAARLYEQEHEVAQTLQRSLLPGGLPDVPGMTIAARYTPAGTAAQVGGDWYDAFPLSDGRLAVVIGDVVGHGLRAAALMGQLRNGVRAYALDGLPPTELAVRLNRLLRELERGQSATLIYAIVDPDTETVAMTAAGHLPPLLRSPDGSSRLLDLPASPPLGVVRRHAYEETRVEFVTGSTLLLFTDGLVERRGEDLEQSLARLEEVAADGPAEPEALCDRLSDELLAPGAGADDAAALAVGSTPLPPELSLLLPAELESATLARRVLSRWLRQMSGSDSEAEEIKLACSEACANAIEHAYSPARAVFRVEARMDGDEVVVAVRDWGRWRKQRGEFRGRGLLLMEGLMDGVDVNRAAHGSTVTLKRRLRREAGA